LTTQCLFSPSDSTTSIHLLGRPEIIATAVLHGSPGVALVDPGPTTTIPL
jgi:hypothetical protein